MVGVGGGGGQDQLLMLSPYMLKSKQKKKKIWEFSKFSGKKGSGMRSLGQIHVVRVYEEYAKTTQSNFGIDLNSHLAIDIIWKQKFPLCP